MGAKLPDLSEERFYGDISKCSPRELQVTDVEKLYRHYQELRRWNPRLSLIGPGTAQDVVSRHYCEALQALRLLPERAFAGESTGGKRLHLVDIGSGGGFPGFVLAATCPGLDVTLVEARQKKWSFLRTVSRKAGVQCVCVNSRVEVPLPEALPDTIHLLALRALTLPAPVFEALRSRLPSHGRLLLWQTSPPDEPPDGFQRLRVLALPGSHRRCIGEYGLEGRR